MTADTQPVEERRREDVLRTCLEETRLPPEMLRGRSATKAAIQRNEERFLTAPRAVRDE